MTVMNTDFRDRARLLRRLAWTAAIATFLPHPGFPVDIRHNAKIDRDTLARWASRALQGASR